MAGDVKIEEIYVVGDYIDALSNLLIKVVNEGAAIGFLPPINQITAKEYWQEVLTPGVILFVAKVNNETVGSIQLHLCTKQNGLHRAEICKVITDPQFRRQGIASTLLKTVEKRAKQEGRTLLILDTREGDPSNFLYQSMGYMESGKIPNFAKSANGDLHTTVIYYKMI